MRQCTIKNNKKWDRRRKLKRQVADNIRTGKELTMSTLYIGYSDDMEWVLDTL